MANSTEILEDRIKINRALRSLYRLDSFLKNGSYPEIIINLEKEILKQALLDLDEIQIKQISLSWKEYVISSVVSESALDYVDNSNFKIFLNNLN